MYPRPPNMEFFDYKDLHDRDAEVIRMFLSGNTKQKNIYSPQFMDEEVIPSGKRRTTTQPPVWPAVISPNSVNSSSATNSSRSRTSSCSSAANSHRSSTNSSSAANSHRSSTNSSSAANSHRSSTNSSSAAVGQSTSATPPFTYARILSDGLPKTEVKKTQPSNVNSYNGIPQKTKDSSLLILCDTVKKYDLNFKAKHFQPRGLKNGSNWCYLNAALQSLLAAAAFRNLLLDVQFLENETLEEKAPFLSAFVRLAKMFSPMAEPFANRAHGKKGKARRELVAGSAFTPTMIRELLTHPKMNKRFEPSIQHDSEEVVSAMLGILDEECKELARQTPEDMRNGHLANGHLANGHLANGHLANGHLTNGGGEEEEGGEWQEVSSGRHKTMSRDTEDSTLTVSPIKKIWGGSFKISNYTPQGVLTSEHIMPFYFLQLDIESRTVNSLDGAIWKSMTYSGRTDDTAHDYKLTRHELMHLPQVLSCHNKYFCYDRHAQTPKKLHKRMGFQVDLVIPEETISPAELQSKYATAGSRRYRLVSVEMHHGEEARGGHYTSYVYDSGLQTWVHYDDGKVSRVTLQQMMENNTAYDVPYILHYEKVEHD